MAIILRTGAEPFTDATKNGATSILADSDATRILAHQLRRYCQGMINGKSFLIAGQRGSGKTTLVLSNIEKLMRESRREQYKFLPLFVPLHGPSLLLDPEDRPTITRYVKQGDKTVPKEIPLTAIAVALTQITLGLYQAMATAMTDQYRNRIDQLAQDSSPAPREQTLQLRELLEVAAQLEFELDSYVEPARLRDFWKWGGFLKDGVLFSREHRRPLDQGYREVLALGSVCEAHRRISGEFVQEETSSAGAETKESAGVSVDTSKVDLMSPLVALASGGAVSAAVWGSLGGLPAAVAGVITALGAALTLNYSASRSRERKASRQITFLPDLSVATLDRVLPVIVKRVRDAGFAPVFVVDELDKVKNLSERLLPIVGNLKKIVAEKAIFCFLTDREYFEEIQSIVTGNKDSVLHTYYTHQLFVTFKPDDLHAYLAQVLTLPGAENPPSRSEDYPTADDEDSNRVNVEARDRYLSGLRTRKLSRQYPEEAADRDVLPYVLLHQARMHTVDLHRRLAALRGAENSLSMPLGAVRTEKASQFDLLIQLAIEMLLDRPVVLAALEREPDLRRLVYDALYYPSRRWRHGKLKLHLDKKKDLHAYLRSRMGIGERPVPKNDGGDAKPTAGDAAGSQQETEAPDTATSKTAGGAGAPNSQNDPAAQQADKGGRKTEAVDEENSHAVDLDKRTQELLLQNEDFLIELVQSLAELLSDTAYFEAQLKSWREQTGKRLSRAVRDALPDPSSGALLLKLSHPRRFRWRYLYSGVLVEGEEPAVASDPEAAYAEKRKFILNFSEFIENLGGDPAAKVANQIDLSSLSTNFGIIGSRPAWPSVQRIVHITAQPSDEERSVVNEYCSLLARRGETLALALYCAAAISKASGNPGGNGLLLGLETLSQGYRLLEFEADSLDEKLATLMAAIQSRFAELPDVDLPPALEPASREEWRNWVADGLGNVGRFVPAAENEDLQRASDEAWEAWRSRIVPSGQTDVSPSPTFDQLICHAAQQPPATLLKFDDGAMTLRDWSKALYSSNADISVGSADYAPLWVMVPVMKRLGLIPGRPRGLNAVAGLYEKRAVSDDDINLTLLYAEAEATKKKPTSAALIVRSSKTSLTELWRPSPSHPAVILSASEARIFVETIKRFRGTDLFDFDRLIVEEPSDNDAIDAIAKELGRTPPDRLFYPGKAQPKPVRIPYLEAPINSVQELLERKPLIFEPEPPQARQNLWQRILELFKRSKTKTTPETTSKDSQNTQ